MPKNKKQQELENQVKELTADLQRLRADFENYRKRVELEKSESRQRGAEATILKILPVVDNIERAIAHVPDKLKSDSWAQGVIKLTKNLEQSLANLNVHRIEASPGTPFSPQLHEAIQMEDGEGDNEIIAEELQAGYTLSGNVIRPSMVKVGRSDENGHHGHTKKVISEELADAEESEPHALDRGED